MKKFFIFTLFFIILILQITYLNPYEKYVDFDLLKKEGPPRFIENGILFTLRGEEGAIAFLRTNIDNWQKDHYYSLSLYNILYVFVPYPENIKTIKYKINLNGHWMSDPNNNDFSSDDIGIDLSSLSIPKQEMYYDQMPIIEKSKNLTKKTTFRYYNPNAKEVNFVYSVDNWSHYSHTMKYDNNGYWTITKYFTQGTYLYYFLVDGDKMIDVENPNKLWDAKKGQVSFFIIE
jgi:hypothetical protein